MLKNGVLHKVERGCFIGAAPAPAYRNAEFVLRPRLVRGLKGGVA